MEEIATKNKRVQLLEDTFGIELPEFKIHTSSRSIESEPIEEGGVLIPSKWKHIPHCSPLPSEFEMYLPKEGMSPEQAIAQLNACSSMARGYGNDSYELYSQDIMMRFHCIAIKNCIYLASLDYENWSQGHSADDDKTFLSAIKKEMWILHEAFSKERPTRFLYEKQMGHLFLRLLLENNAPLNKGVEMGPTNGRKNIFYNTVHELLFAGFNEGAHASDNDLDKYVTYFLSHKCYEITEQLLQLND